MLRIHRHKPKDEDNDEYRSMVSVNLNNVLPLGLFDLSDEHLLHFTAVSGLHKNIYMKLG